MAAGRRVEHLGSSAFTLFTLPRRVVRDETICGCASRTNQHAKAGPAAEAAPVSRRASDLTTAPPATPRTPAVVVVPLTEPFAGVLEELAGELQLPVFD